MLTLQMNRPMYEYQDLTPETDFKTFKCADSDLNDFLYEEAKGYQSQLLAKTYLVVNSENQDVIAYFSLLNDAVRLEDTERSVRNRINRRIPNNKRHKHYPAVKIGRLAVDERYAHMGFGELILKTVCRMFRTNNRTGCRFITVDALSSATDFYEAKGAFRFFTEQDIADDTRLMYFDLKDFGEE